jgi:hypothetical protein
MKEKTGMTSNERNKKPHHGTERVEALADVKLLVVALPLARGHVVDNHRAPVKDKQKSHTPHCVERNANAKPRNGGENGPKGPTPKEMYGKNTPRKKNVNERIHKTIKRNKPRVK